MRRGVLKVTACCLATTMVFAGNGVPLMAAGLDSQLAGLGSRIEEQTAKKEAAGGTVQVAASGYDTIAIAQVNEYVNIRDAAGENGAVIGKLYNNSGAEILGQEGDWYLIKSGNVTGYVKSEFFATGQKAQELAAEVATEVATVNTTTLMVRSKANEEADILTMVGDSENLHVLADEGDWVKVAVDDDVEGYVSKDYVERKTEFIEAESIEKVEERESAVKEAAEQAKKMQEAAISAMNSGSADEAAYAAYMANEAAAQAKVLAAEQTLDYDVQEIAAQAVAAAEDAAWASTLAEQAEAAAAAQAQAEADAASQAAAAEAAAQAEADAAANAQAQANQAAQEAAQAQEDANQNWNEEAQAAADAAAQEAANAQAAADAAAAAQAQAEAEADAAAAQAQAEADAAAQQLSDSSQSQDTSSDSGATNVDTSGTSSTRQNIVNFALQFVGNPYVYGGTSLTNGADCSGFTQSVMANFGISIPRTAGAQSGSGRAVDLGSIQPGDLLFYSGSGDYGIGHVTMYIGNGQVVHASNSRTGIIVSSIDYRTPCAARSYI